MAHQGFLYLIFLQKTVWPIENTIPAKLNFESKKKKKKTTPNLVIIILELQAMLKI